MLDIQEEKKIIYEILKKIITEKEDLNRQYDGLSERLDVLNNIEQVSLTSKNRPSISILEKERIQDQDYFYRKNKTLNHVPFDRVSKNILAILKQSPIPLSNKQLLQKLNTEYELHVTYKNLTCNILPKMLKERSLPIERAHRGYWQYHLPKS